MPCTQAVGRLLLVLVVLVLSVASFSDPAPREAAVLRNLKSAGDMLGVAATQERAKLVACGLAGLMVVGSVLVLIKAKERYCVFGTALLLYCWLIEGLFAFPFQKQAIPDLLKAASMLGALLLT